MYVHLTYSRAQDIDMAGQYEEMVPDAECVKIVTGMPILIL